MLCDALAIFKVHISRKVTYFTVHNPVLSNLVATYSYFSLINLKFKVDTYFHYWKTLVCLEEL